MNQTGKNGEQSLDSLWNMAERQSMSRRTFLALMSSSGAAAALAACQSGDVASSLPQPKDTPIKHADLIYASAAALAKAIRTKQLSSEEVIKAYLQRIEDVNPKLNAVVQLTAETALTQARELDAALARGEIKGPLHGVPFTVKDNIETAGVICTAGTKGRSSFVPAEDATIVARLRAAGAIMLGKTNLPGLGTAYETDNVVYGLTNNPYDFSRSPGASSGGEAAIIAAGGSPFGLGNDFGGSIRLPAHCCGITGIKPTSGRVPRTGTVPGPGGPLDKMWQAGPMARFVEDLTLTLPLLAGVDGRDAGIVSMPLDDPQAVTLKGLRVALYTTQPLVFDASTLAAARKTVKFLAEADSMVITPTTATVEVVRKTAKVLAAAGMVVEEDRPPITEQSVDLLSRLAAADGGAGVRTFLRMLGTTELSPLLQQLLDLWSAFALSPPEFIKWLSKWETFRSAMLSFMERYDVILCPVSAYPALPHALVANFEQTPAFVYTITYNLAGLPAAVVRGGTSPEGLPIGVQVVARPWREDVTLAVAQHIETALGGWQRPAF